MHLVIQRIMLELIYSEPAPMKAHRVDTFTHQPDSLAPSGGITNLPTLLSTGIAGGVTDQLQAMMTEHLLVDQERLKYTWSFDCVLGKFSQSSIKNHKLKIIPNQIILNFNCLNNRKQILCNLVNCPKLGKKPQRTLHTRPGTCPRPWIAPDAPKKTFIFIFGLKNILFLPAPLYLNTNLDLLNRFLV